VRLYFHYFMIQLKSAMQYKVSFFLTLGSQLIISLSAFFEVYFLFTRFKSVAGFTFEEVLLCYSAIMASYSIVECFMRGFDVFPTIIANAKFDRIMVRPQNEILQVLGEQADFSRLSRILQAVVVMCYAIPMSGILWTWQNVLLYMLMIVCGVLLFAGLFVVYASLSFFTTEGIEFMNIFINGGREFGAYPFAVYGKNVLRIVTYFIPLALVQYYPFLYLTGRTENILYFFLPVIALFFLIPCMLLWKLGMRHYRSVGS